MRAWPILAGLLALAACTPPVAVAPADVTPTAHPIGAALRCLSTTQISDTDVRDDRTIDFRVIGGRTYRNTLPYPCPDLGFERSFGYKLSTPMLCSSDSITVLHSGSRGPSCGLGEFVPVALESRR